MKAAVYAGSFDPWSFGHQYILESALQVFDTVHILAAVNPAKPGLLDPVTRARVIAHAIEPFGDWWQKKPPFKVGKSVVVSATTGLVVNYAREHDIVHLIRGLRSTSDFEAEFNLYFSNRAIDSSMQTWAVMSPPELLHCSSTYVKTVVGKIGVEFVGTSFLAQAIMLKGSPVLGEMFDLLELLSTYRFESSSTNLNESDINAALQLMFTAFIAKEREYFAKGAESALRAPFKALLKKNENTLRRTLSRRQFPSDFVNAIWALLCSGFVPAKQKNAVGELARLAGMFGKTGIPLFDKKQIESALGTLASATMKRKTK